MFKSISKDIPMPDWADDRWKRLYRFDLWLQSQFYDHLEHSFYEEAEGETYIPIAQRRPSVQFNLPAHISSSIARKLFGGRHVPRLIRRGTEGQFEQEPVMTRLNEIVSESQFWAKMLEAAFWGSVGSVAVTFRVSAQTQNTGKLVFDVWRARDCYPDFDKFGELSKLRITRTGLGRDFICLDYPKPLDKNSKRVDYEPDKFYWFVRDLTATQEITYIPMEESAWKPTGLDAEDEWIELQEDKEKTVTHNLGFVPGVWIQNMPGGTLPDGQCTWERALNTCIEADYTMSQLGRGIRYAAAPQLVIKGDLRNWDWSNPGNVKLTKSPAHVLQLEADTKDATGGTVTGGSASLLEMKGNGIQSGLSYYEHIRKIALEQISASRKDPDKFRVPQSGRAMEVLDEDFHDLVHEQRQYYGDGGALPLLRKAFIAGIKSNMLKGVDKALVQELTLLWPRLYQPSPMDIQAFAMAMEILVGVPGSPAASGANGSMGRAIPQQGIMIIKPEEARQLFEAMVDIPPKPAPVGVSVPKVTPQDEPSGVPNPTVSTQPPTNGNGNPGSITA